MLHFIIETSNFTSFIIRELKINGFNINNAIKYYYFSIKNIYLIKYLHY